MHHSVRDYVCGQVTEDMVSGKLVLEVGSADINGSVRPDVEVLKPWRYLGVDASEGRRVDLVLDAGRLPEHFADRFDLVITCEMLEHVRDWPAALRGCIAAVARGGYLLITTRSPGFPYHAFPEDHWRFPVDVMGKLLNDAGLDVEDIRPDPECPGVFALAHKPADWSLPVYTAGRWDDAAVTRVEAPGQRPDRGGTVADSKDTGKDAGTKDASAKDAPSASAAQSSARAETARAETNSPQAKVGAPSSGDNLSRLPYQVLPQVRQLLEVRKNAVAHEHTDQVDSVDKTLRGLGYMNVKSAEDAVVAATERAQAMAGTRPEPDATTSSMPSTPEGQAALEAAKADKDASEAEAARTAHPTARTSPSSKTSKS